MKTKLSHVYRATMSICFLIAIAGSSIGAFELAQWFGWFVVAIWAFVIALAALSCAKDSEKEEHELP